MTQPLNTLLEISREDALRLRDAFTSISASPYTDFQAFRDHVFYSVPALGPTLTGRLLSFRTEPWHNGFLLLRGLPLDSVLPLTPTDPLSLATIKKTFVTEGCLTAVASVLGSIFAYQEEDDGVLVQSILPRPYRSEGQTSYFGAHTLPFHTEVAWAPVRPSFLLLYCVRSDPNYSAITHITTCAKTIANLSDATILSLTQPLYRLRASEAFRNYIPEDHLWTPRFPLLEDRGSHLELRVNFRYLETLSPEAQMAATCLHQAMQEQATSLRLEDGDLLLVDNRTAAHARTSYKAVLDGTDRWLHRMYVVSDIWPARSGLTKAPSVISVARILDNQSAT